jgi:hypothetical protein
MPLGEEEEEEDEKGRSLCSEVIDGAFLEQNMHQRCSWGKRSALKN